jgi:hypothetical protein
LVGICSHMLLVHGAVPHRILFISFLSMSRRREQDQTHCQDNKISSFHDRFLLLKFPLEFGDPFGLSARECSSMALAPGLVRPSFTRHCRTSSFI